MDKLFKDMNSLRRKNKNKQQPNFRKQKVNEQVSGCQHSCPKKVKSQWLYRMAQLHSLNRRHQSLYWDN